MTPNAQKSDMLRQEVTKLLESDTFARSKANRALLMYLAEEFFSGRGDEITEYGIAHELLGRDADFDPSTDPIVRVRMRRLREAIAAYYEQNPECLERLNIPRGSYAFALQQLESPQPPKSEPIVDTGPAAVSAESMEVAGAGVGAAVAPVPTPSTAENQERSDEDGSGRRGPSVKKRRLLWGLVGAVVLVAAFVVAILGYGMRREVGREAEMSNDVPYSGYPIIAIAPFANLTGLSDNDVYEKDVQRQLAGDFQRFGRLQVRVLTADLNRNTVGSDYILRGSILNLVGELDLAVDLMEVETGKVLFQSRISGPLDEIDFYSSLRQLSQRISAYLAAQGGVISTFGQPRAEAAGAVGNVFYCVLLTDAFLETYAPETFQAAYRCFEPLRATFDTDAVAAASFGTLMLHAVPDFHFMDLSGVPERMHSTPEDVTEYADELVDRFPGADAAFILLGALYNAKGEISLAIRALRQAVDLNPANPTTYGVLSYAYLSADLLDASEEAARSAVRLSASPSAYMYLPLLVVGIVHKNARMVDIARKGYADQVSPSRDIFLLAAASMIGDGAEVERLAEIVGQPDDPMSNIRMYVQGDVALSAIARHLKAAGLEVPDPTCLSSASGNVSRGLDCAP